MLRIHNKLYLGKARPASGGGDAHNKGYFSDENALVTAYPTAESGDYAVVGTTDTVWIWDEDTSAWIDSDQKGQVTSVNNKTGDVTVQETLVSGTNIKTINGQDILGSGDLELSTYLPYPAGWTTNQSTMDFCNDIANDNTAVVGKAYLGEVTINDLPAGIANAEIVVEIMSGTTALDKVIVLTMTSGNKAPYMWKYTYWNNGGDVSGWIGFQPELPDQSSHAGEVITTDGVNLYWKKLTDMGAVSQTTVQVTLYAANWQPGTPIMQGVSVPGLDPADTVIVSPDPASATDYASAGVICVAQGQDYLEFNCTTQPANDIMVNLLILK